VTRILPSAAAPPVQRVARGRRAHPRKVTAPPITAPDPTPPAPDARSTRPLADERLRRNLLSAAIVAVLYLVYSPVFLTDYLMNDEWRAVGLRPGFLETAQHNFFNYGRFLFGLYTAAVYRFAGYDAWRIQVVRFVNFASLCAIAVVLFRFLDRRSRGAWTPFLVTLFLFSLRPFQSAMAYSVQMIANTQPAMWLSLLASQVHFSTRQTRIPAALRLGLVSLLLVLAFQSTQTYALFALVPLTFWTLRDWAAVRRRVLSFLAIAVLVFAGSVLAYKAGLESLHAEGRRGYSLGEAGVDALGSRPSAVLAHAVSPATYWSAFEAWPYPFPFHSLPSLGKTRVRIAYAVMAAWATLLLACVLVELRGSPAAERRQVVAKWAVVGLFLALGASFIVADSPLATVAHRPHMLVCFVGTAVLAAAYAAETLAARQPSLQGRAPVLVAVLLVAASVAGAQASTLRGFVLNRKAELDFVRAELLSRDPATYRNILVLIPRWNGCPTEPCGPWVGYATEAFWPGTLRAAREGRRHGPYQGYLYALASAGVPVGDKTVAFVESPPPVLPTDSMLVDWERYLAVARTQVNHLRRNASS
jgi:hypothetical protein